MFIKKKNACKSSALNRILPNFMATGGWPPWHHKLPTQRTTSGTCCWSRPVGKRPHSFYLFYFLNRDFYSDIQFCKKKKTKKKVNTRTVTVTAGVKNCILFLTKTRVSIPNRRSQKEIRNDPGTTRPRVVFE